MSTRLCRLRRELCCLDARVDKAYEHFADNSTGRYLLTDGIITITVGGYLNHKLGLTPMHIKVQSSVFAGTEEGFASTQELLDWAKKTQTRRDGSHRLTHPS